MTTVEIPVVADEVAFSLRAELDGAFFGLSFRWNDRASVWLLDITDDDGADVVLGLTLVTGVPINAGLTHVPAAPAGLLTVLDTEGRGGTPGVDDLGTRYRVLFTPYADLEEAA